MTSEHTEPRNCACLHGLVPKDCFSFSAQTEEGCAIVSMSQERGLLMETLNQPAPDLDFKGFRLEVGFVSMRVFPLVLSTLPCLSWQRWFS